jgi:hypothetical protein
MNVAMFGGFGKRMLSSGWTKETAIAFAGGGEFDLTNITPGDNARLTAFAMFGGIDIVVDEGTQVTMTGFNAFGSREVAVAAADGPAIHVRAFALFGGIKVSPPESTQPSLPEG